MNQCVQASGSEASIEGLDEGVVGRFAGATEVQCDAILVGPQIEVARDKFPSLVEPDCPRVANLPADLFEGADNIFTSVRNALPSWVRAFTKS